MDNIMLLQKQRFKPSKIALIIADVCVVLLIALLAMAGVTDVLVSTSGVLIVAVALIAANFFGIKAIRPDESLKNLPPDVLNSANRECMTGMRYSNGILCESGVLLIVGMRTNMDANVRAVMCRDIKRLNRDRMGHMERIIVTDMRGKIYQISNSSPAVSGNGTFREADIDTFWAELNAAKERYAE